MEPEGTDPHASLLPAHRLEALTDGIYAVAMTLLVIELKLPEHAGAASSGELVEALVDLSPKIVSWVVSFFVLGFFWVGHHRAFAHVRRADGPLVALNLAQLACVSLMPFSSALSGEHGGAFVSQVVYSLNMIGLSVFALLITARVHHHRELTDGTVRLSHFEGARLRIVGLIVISVVAVAIVGVAARRQRRVPAHGRRECRQPPPGATARGPRGDGVSAGPALQLDAVTCTFAPRVRGEPGYTAVRDVTLSIAAGEFVSVVGPTGCGKSTLLNVAAGLLAPSAGDRPRVRLSARGHQPARRLHVPG